MTGQKGLLLEFASIEVSLQFGPVLQVVTDHLVHVGQFEAGKLL